MTDEAQAAAAFDDIVGAGLGDGGLDVGRPRCRESVQLAGPVLAQPLLQGRQALREAGTDRAAVAPRGPPAEAPGLQEHDVVAAPSQLARGGQAGESATDDAGLGLQVFAQARTRRPMG